MELYMEILVHIIKEHPLIYAECVIKINYVDVAFTIYNNFWTSYGLWRPYQAIFLQGQMKFTSCNSSYISAQYGGMITKNSLWCNWKVRTLETCSRGLFKRCRWPRWFIQSLE